ncbi:GDP-L-fucose synthase family protein [Carboxylicivirga linearis]|uniref:GDP-L-fucose synthase n=1 Tax=Carboxylicivirga linearis TaxID=1628157 RepID=A0ABS5JRF6_9BACT|nr:GDP-L-fucose synthase [Carboxylicivirga linearis]MBS2097469.1 GDP-L-fucose synthase [Carboxylicivirga linearis]
MDKNAKIYIAGHRGLVGSAILRELQKEGYTNFVTKTRAELDLLDQKAVSEFFKQEKPDYVFLAAAKVGGIMANNTYRGAFIYENLQIQNNIIHSAYESGVKKLLFLGSSCIYPKNAPQPLKEDYLLSEELEYTNEPYAIAKIAGIKMCESYNLQYGTDYISVMPTNLYGPNDNYNLETSHVLPALIRKMHLGKLLKANDWSSIDIDLNNRPIEGVSGTSSQEEKLAILEKYGIYLKDNSVVITLWGSGKPMREFLHSDDMAAACIYVMNNISFDDVAEGKTEVRNTHVNIGCGEDLTIKDLALTIKEVVDYDGELVWDADKPDGTMRKLMDVSKLEKLGWKATISLKDGIANVYGKYCE